MEAKNTKTEGRGDFDNLKYHVKSLLSHLLIEIFL